MDYRQMSTDQLYKLRNEFVKRGNHNASREINDFIAYHGKRVRVTKGHKVPIGTEGEVFWVKRYDNSRYGDSWGIYSTTKVGIRDAEGYAHFTAISNVVLIADSDGI